MIAVNYRYQGDQCTFLSVKGHAGSAEYGKDLICAAVSSILFGLMNALDEIEGISIIKKEGKIEIENQSGLEKVRDYFDLVLIQLRTIEASDSEFIRIERK